MGKKPVGTSVSDATGPQSSETTGKGPSAKAAPKKEFDVEAKVKKIEASKMPDWQKKEYIRDLKKSGQRESGAKLISFTVYANIKKISEHIREGMKHYPAAKGMVTATFEDWEAAYKGF